MQEFGDGACLEDYELAGREWTSAFDAPGVDDMRVQVHLTLRDGFVGWSLFGCRGVQVGQAVARYRSLVPAKGSFQEFLLTLLSASYPSLKRINGVRPSRVHTIVFPRP